MASLPIREAGSPGDLAVVSRLFNTYANSFGINLCVQNFDQELAGLPGLYAPPPGCLFLAGFDGIAGGCVAMRPLQKETYEMKRLFVSLDHRGSGAGRLLALAVMAKAKTLGYQAICLDTVPSMATAIEIYESLGIQSIEPYCDNPIPGALFLECKL